MPTIKQIKDKVILASQGIDNATSKIIKDNEENILNYIRNDQLFKGKDSEGSDITAGGAYNGVYSYNYGSQSLGGSDDYSKPITTKKEGQPYNFTWSGETMKGFITKYSNYSLEIINTGNNSNYLIGFYNNGEKLFQMSEVNKERLRTEIIVPNLTSYLKGIFK